MVIMRWISKASTGNIFTLISIVIALLAFTYQITSDKNFKSSNQFAQKTDNEITSSEIDFFESVGIKVILTPDKKTWQEIISYGVSSYKEGSPENIIKARTIASIKAKSNIAHFLKEEINSKKTLQILSTESNNIQNIITSITNTSHIIIKGIEVLDTKKNTNQKIIRVKARIKNNGV